MNELAPGLFHWTARHPDWHPAEGDGFGARVGSYALVAGDDLVLIDPLLAPEDPTLLDALAAASRNTYIFITIGYHVRSAAALSERYGATVHGPPQARGRLDTITVLEPGTPGPAGVTAHIIGRPRRGETPLWLPSHEAIAFGDALVTTPDGELRMWCQEPVDVHRRAFYRDRFAPTLQPLLTLNPTHILPTHGAPFVGVGAAALRSAIAAGPWYHRG